MDYEDEEMGEKTESRQAEVTIVREITLDVRAEFYGGKPAKTDCRWEDCEQAQEPYLDEDSIEIVNIETGEQLSWDSFSTDEQDEIIEKLSER